MAQVARANSAAAGGDPRALKRLSVQFRGMGFPEQEVTVTGTVKRADGGTVVVDTVAEQNGNQIIRNAEAELQAPGLTRAVRGSRADAATLESDSMLTERQRAILGAVVTRHVRDGGPVGSKADLRRRAGVEPLDDPRRARQPGGARAA